MRIIAVVYIVVLFPLNAGTQPANPRSPAEWEEVQGVVMEGRIIVPSPKLYEDAIEPYEKVAQACINESIDFYLLDPQDDNIDFDTVFRNRQVLSPRIHIIDVESYKFANFPWARDNAQFCIYENKVGTMHLAGFPRDSAAHLMASELGYHFHWLPESFSIEGLYNDGGNHLTDGHGTFTIKTTRNRAPNGLFTSMPEYKEYMGIEKTLNLTGVKIHSDYWLKLLDEETFIVSHIPHENYHLDIDTDTSLQDTIDANVQLIQSKLSSAFGRAFTFIPIRNAPSFNDDSTNTLYSTDEASYTNSLILNKTVLVPQFLAEPYDSLALLAYEAAMPGYHVIGVNCRNYAVAGGALHCITRELYADNPIYIKHAWLKGAYASNEGYDISATVQSQGGLEEVKLCWTSDLNAGFQSVIMYSGENDEFTATIPPQADGSIIHYYISARNNSRKTIRKPMTAPDGFFTFLVDKISSMSASEPDAEWMIYPNPARDVLTIHCPNTGTRRLHIEIFSMDGRLMLKQKLEQGDHSMVNIGRLKDGMYLVRLFDAHTGSAWAKKIFKIQ